MPEPYNNIFIGSDPRDGSTKEWADQFDAIINVSCTQGVLFEPSRVDQRTYWYPVNEIGEWSYAYFIYIFKVIDHHYRAGHKIYIHCHAGAYRSPSIFRWWLVTCENKTLEKANEIERGRSLDDLSPHMRHYSIYKNFILGNIPPKFQDYIYRIRCLGIEKANFTCVLNQPKRLSKRPEVCNYPSPTLNEIVKRLIYNIKKSFKRVAELIRYYVDKRIEIKNGAWTEIASDWKRLSKDRPKYD